MRFAFIAVEKASYPVRLLCRVLDVSRAGFYAWQGRAPSAHAQADERLGLEIAAIHRRAGSATAARGSTPNCGTAATAPVASAWPG